MKKLLSTILCSVLTIGLIIQPSTAFASSIDKTNSTSIAMKPILTDNQSGETLDSAIKNIKKTYYQTRSDGAIIQSYEVDITLPINNSTLRDVSGGTITEADCKATLDITYFLSNNNQDIQITNISGGWKPQSSLILVSNRVASVTDGALMPFNKVLRNNPTSNSFSYNTGWAKGTFYPGSEYSGARGYTEATLSIPGMGGSYNLFLPVAISR